MRKTPEGDAVDLMIIITWSWINDGNSCDALIYYLNQLKRILYSDDAWFGFTYRFS